MRWQLCVKEICSNSIRSNFFCPILKTLLVEHRKINFLRLKLQNQNFGCKILNKELSFPTKSRVRFFVEDEQSQDLESQSHESDVENREENNFDSSFLPQ